MQVGGGAGMDQGGGRGNRQAWMGSGPSTDVDPGRLGVTTGKISQGSFPAQSMTAAWCHGYHRELSAEEVRLVSKLGRASLGPCCDHHHRPMSLG